jgi:hypothetical protein
LFTVSEVIITKIVLREDIPQTVSKPVLSWFAKEQIKKISGDLALDLGMHSIDQISLHRHIAFEEEDAYLKREVAEVLASKEEYDRAAKMLEKINLENASRAVEADEKAEVYV